MKVLGYRTLLPPEEDEAGNPLPPKWYYHEEPLRTSEPLFGVPQDGFKYKLVRCAWVTRVYTVDEYGLEPITSEVWYYKEWPTREEAVADLERITVKGDNPNHRTYPEAKHSYYSCGVSYRDVVCN